MRAVTPPASRRRRAAGSCAAWLAASVLGPSPVLAAEPATDAARGRALIAQYQCGRCHVVPGVPGAGGELAVTLQAFGRRSYIAGRWPNRADLLARWIADPAAMVPGTAMPDLGVAERDARDIAAYLLELR